MSVIGRASGSYLARLHVDLFYAVVEVGDEDEVPAMGDAEFGDMRGSSRSRRLDQCLIIRRPEEHLIRLCMYGCHIRPVTVPELTEGKIDHLTSVFSSFIDGSPGHFLR